MVKVSVLYPNKPGARFDVEYYLNTHMPMSARLLGAAVKAITVEIGRPRPGPDDAPPFAAIVDSPARRLRISCRRSRRWRASCRATSLPTLTSRQ